MIWGLAVFAGLVAWFVHGLFDSFYEFTPTYTAFWLLAALGMGCAWWAPCPLIDGHAPPVDNRVYASRI